MKVRAITKAEQLRALEPQWFRLAGDNPFLSWDWLGTWWTVYGEERNSRRPPRKQLYVLAVFDSVEQDQLRGVAPLFLEKTVARGNVLRLLGTGEVCSDHLSIVCDEADCQPVATVLADYLTTTDDWHVIDLASIDADDQPIAALASALSERECNVLREPADADACWQVALPATWDEYLALQSKSHRKQLRRAERRVLDSDRVAWHPARTEAEFAKAWEILVDLHQRRRKGLGEPGCFASQSFSQFHQEVAPRLLRRGQLRLSWLELDGQPAAAEYHVADGSTTYAYQGGVDPGRLDEEPGRLSTILCLRSAIEEGHRTFDFLRGNEPYKAHWRAQPQATFDYRIVPNRRLAQLRGRMLGVAGSVAELLRSEGHSIAGTSSGAVP